MDLPVEGEMRTDTAIIEDMLRETYEFSELNEPAYVLVFPYLKSGNIAYELDNRRLAGSVRTTDPRPFLLRHEYENSRNMRRETILCRCDGIPLWARIV